MHGPPLLAPMANCSARGAKAGDGPGQFHVPHGIAIDAQGTVYVADRENSRISCFRPMAVFSTNGPTRPARQSPSITAAISWWPSWAIGPGCSRATCPPPDETTGGRVSVLDSRGHCWRAGVAATILARPVIFSPRTMFASTRSATLPWRSHDVGRRQSRTGAARLPLAAKICSAFTRRKLHDHRTRPARTIHAVIFAAAGCKRTRPPASPLLTEANLVGHDSHGVIRITDYIELLKAGKVLPNQMIQVVFENEHRRGRRSIWIWPEYRRAGHTAGDREMSRARRGSHRATNTGHLGRIGDWPLRWPPMPAKFRCTSSTPAAQASSWPRLAASIAACRPIRLPPACRSRTALRSSWTCPVAPSPKES